MIYKINMMSGQEIILEDESAVEAFLSEANAGKKLILTKHGIVNVASVDSIVRHKEAMEEFSSALRIGKTHGMAMRDVVGDSPFAKLLGAKLGISDKVRTGAQEDGARGDRTAK